MEFSLTPFPGEEFPPGLRVAGTIRRRGNELRIDYALEGDLSALALPARAARPQRRDRLWEETCLELFLAPRGGEGYLELNLSPAGHWNAYRFDSYREGMREEGAFAALPFRVRGGPGVLALSLALDLGKLAPGNRDLEASACAVVRTTDGRTSHWAAAHPGPRPDFHRRDGFTIAIPARREAGGGGTNGRTRR